jgi:hypothetical protein
MKKLKKHLKFDIDGFVKDKMFTIKEIKPTYLYEDGKRIDKEVGTTITLIIVQDLTKYDDEEVGVNLYEALNLKVVSSLETIKNKLKMGEIYKLKTESVKATVYGQYQNQLSLNYDGQGTPLLRVKNGTE